MFTVSPLSHSHYQIQLNGEIIAELRSDPHDETYTLNFPQASLLSS